MTHTTAPFYGLPPNWRSLQRTDPQSADEIWRARLAIAQEEYLAGDISRDTFAATLYALGFRASELTLELVSADERRASANAKANANI